MDRRAAQALPSKPGLYAWYFRGLPAPVSTEVCHARGDFCLCYVGVAPQAPRLGKPPSKTTLRRRILSHHFNGNASASTLRLSLGVLLGLRLRAIGSTGRLTFGTSEACLSRWIEANARVVVHCFEEPWRIEAGVIAALATPLNLRDNRTHGFHATLSAMRQAAKASARRDCPRGEQAATPPC